MKTTALCIALSSAYITICNAQFTVSENPSFWLKASDLVGADDSAVTAWNDASGNGFHLSNGDSSQQPILKTSFLNGENVVRFDGVNDYLFRDLNAGEAASLIDLNTSTVFIVQQNNGGDPTTASLAWTGSGQNQLAVNADYNGTITFDHGDLGSGGGEVNLATPGGFTGSAHVLTFQRNGTDALIHMDGLNQTPLTPSGFNAGNTLDTSAAGRFAVGGFTSLGALTIDGDIAEVIIFKGALSANDIETVEQYLGGKYGLTVVPEPSEYATIFAGLALGAVLVRRFRRQQVRNAAAQ